MTWRPCTVAASAILLVARDPAVVEAVRREVERTLGGPPTRVVETVGRAAELADDPDVGAVLVHFAEGVEVVDVEYLIRRVSARPAPVPVLVLSRDLYDAGHASVLFQLGVTDYLSLSDHLGRLAAILGALTSPPDPAPRPLPIAAARIVPERWVPLGELLTSLF